MKALYLAGVLVIGAWSILASSHTNNNNNDVEIIDKFFLAYAEPHTARVRARWSEDGLTWQDGTLPTMTTASQGGDKRPGIGAASNDTGSLYLTAFNKSNGKMGFISGLGPAVWDTTVHDQAYAGYSAPAVAYVGNNYWLVASHTNGSLRIGIYKNDGELISWSPLGGWAASAEARVKNVQGRPTVTVGNGKVLVAWRWYPGSGDFDVLLTATADLPPDSVDTWQEVQSYWGNEGIWTEISEIPLPTDTDYIAGIHSDPDASHAQSTFYLAFVREEISFGGLHSFYPVVYSSSDGLSWSFHSDFVLSVRDGSFVNIAAKSDGTMIAAAVNEGAGAANARISASRYDGSTWRSLSDSQKQNMFGDNNAYFIRFALISAPGT